MLRTPFFLISYDLRSKRTFVVENDDGVWVLPVFTTGELAESYRRYFARKHKLKLTIGVTDTAEKGLNLLENIAMYYPALGFVAVDPPLPTPASPISALSLSEALKSLTSQYRRSRKARSRRNLRKK